MITGASYWPVLLVSSAWLLLAHSPLHAPHARSVIHAQEEVALHAGLKIRIDLEETATNQDRAEYCGKNKKNLCAE